MYIMSVLVEPYVAAVVDDKGDDFVGHSLEAARPHEHRHELLPVSLGVGLEVAGIHYFLEIWMYRIIFETVQIYILVRDSCPCVQ